MLFATLYMYYTLTTRSVGRLLVLRAGSARDHIRPVPVASPGPRFTKGTNFMHHIALVGRVQGRSGSLLLFSYNSFSRNSPFCGVFNNRIRIGLVGRVKCSTKVVKGRRFSLNLSGVTHLFGVTSFPIIYTGCNMRKAILRKLIGPCIVLRHGKVGMNIFKLDPTLRKLMRTGGYRKIIFRGPVRTTRHITSVLGGQRGYSLIIYLSRLK